MSKNEVYLGIDTSCYTTSVALIGREGGLVGEARRILQVKPGCRGLQQSEMVFQHTRNLPILLEEVLKKPLKVIGIGVSARPRPLEDSYMPAFLVGLGLARSLAAVNEIPLWQISHQENHLEAGLWSKFQSSNFKVNKQCQIKLNQVRCLKCFSSSSRR